MKAFIMKTGDDVIAEGIEFSDGAVVTKDKVGATMVFVDVDTAMTYLNGNSAFEVVFTEEMRA